MTVTDPCLIQCTSSCLLLTVTGLCLAMCVQTSVWYCLLHTCVLLLLYVTDLCHTLCVQSPVCYCLTYLYLTVCVQAPVFYCVLQACFLLCVYKPLSLTVCYGPVSYSVCKTCLPGSVTGLCPTLRVQAPVCWHLLQAYVLHCVYKPLFAGVCYRPMCYTAYTSPCLLASAAVLLLTMNSSIK